MARIVLTNPNGAADSDFVPVLARALGPAEVVTIDGYSLERLYDNAAMRALFDAGNVTVRIDREGGEADSRGVAEVLAIHTTLTAGGGGAPDDVTIFNANAPYSFRILDVILAVSTAVGGSTVALRTATGGAGTALTSAISSAATGKARDAVTTGVPAIAANGSVFIRRSDNGVAGSVITLIQRT